MNIHRGAVIRFGVIFIFNYIDDSNDKLLVKSKRKILYALFVAILIKAISVTNYLLNGLKDAKPHPIRI